MRDAGAEFLYGADYQRFGIPLVPVPFGKARADGSRGVLSGRMAPCYTLILSDKKGAAALRKMIQDVSFSHSSIRYLVYITPAVKYRRFYLPKFVDI